LRGSWFHNVVHPRLSGLALLVAALSVAPLAIDEGDGAQQAESAAATAGKLRVKTDTPGAQVFVDGNEVGVTPLTTSVPSGRHSIVLSKGGYLDHAQDLDVPEGKTTTTFVVMKRIESPLPNLPIERRARHLHGGGGSCDGALKISVDRLSYKADAGKDAFEIPIRSITFAARGAGLDLGAALSGSILVGSTGAVRVSGARAPTAGAVLGTIPVRLDTADRNYSFLAYDREGGPENNATEGPLIENIRVRTQEFFDVVYRLFMDDLKLRPK
jgi:PEGA domain-containing protein